MYVSKRKHQGNDVKLSGNCIAIIRMSMVIMIMIMIIIMIIIEQRQGNDVKLSGIKQKVLLNSK